MKNSFLLFLIVSLPCLVCAQNWKHRQMAMGKDTSEIYLSTYWYPYEYYSIYETILHSTDNGLSFAVRNNEFLYTLPGPTSPLSSDSKSGVVYKCPDHAADTFSVSLDTGMTLIKKYFLNSNSPASGCIPGEIYFQSYLAGPVLCRSTDFGSSFDTVPMPDSLELREAGANPGELYFSGYPVVGTVLVDTIMNVVISTDYGATYQSHMISIPYHLHYYDIRRGTSPGEFYLLVWDSNNEDYFYIYHTTDYGNTVTFQQKHECGFWYFKSYTAGRKPGTFYVARRSTWTPDLFIDYSTDYGVTFTTYVHYLDSTYTGTGNRSNPISIKIFPNPGTTQINIELPNDNPYRSLQFMNIFGQVCLQQEITGPANTIDINAMPTGVYFVKLVAKNGVQVRKIIKQ